MAGYITREFNTEGKMISNTYNLLRTPIGIFCHDADGPFTELRDIYRASIDAACLRTSKSIYDMYINLLYSTNNFYFSMAHTSMHRSPPTMLPKGKGFKVWHPRPIKPGSDA
ncbi:hypothetical protein N431DRAFT_468775 [Stipitochalara longipes BDJ]|nr:hypothetical protein N431DRAFT_468775 [Stipitochalara longipes BDJ]